MSKYIPKYKVGTKIYYNGPTEGKIKCFKIADIVPCRDGGKLDCYKMQIMDVLSGDYLGFRHSTFCEDWDKWPMYSARIDAAEIYREILNEV